MTQTVAIVCGAGVSSTFLARAMREQLAERSIAWVVEPLAVDQLSDRLDRLSLVLVAHHMAGSLTEVSAMCDASGVPVVLLHSAHHELAAQQAVTLITDAEISASDDVTKGHPHG